MCYKFGEMPYDILEEYLDCKQEDDPSYLYTTSYTYIRHDVITHFAEQRGKRILCPYESESVSNNIKEYLSQHGLTKESVRNMIISASNSLRKGLPGKPRPNAKRGWKWTDEQKAKLSEVIRKWHKKKNK